MTDETWEYIKTIIMTMIMAYNMGDFSLLIIMTDELNKMINKGVKENEKEDEKA